LKDIKDDDVDVGSSYGDFGRVRRYNNLRNIFDDVDEIGGGCGLNRISPFFQGRGRFRHDWDDKFFNNNQGFIPNVPVVSQVYTPPVVIPPVYNPPPVFIPPVYNPPVVLPVNDQPIVYNQFIQAANEIYNDFDGFDLDG